MWEILGERLARSETLEVGSCVSDLSLRVTEPAGYPHSERVEKRVKFSERDEVIEFEVDSRLEPLGTPSASCDSEYL
jgi:hypothetical protein